MRVNWAPITNIQALKFHGLKNKFISHSCHYQPRVRAPDQVPANPLDPWETQAHSSSTVSSTSFQGCPGHGRPWVWGRSVESRGSIGQAGKWPTSPKEKPDNANWLCAGKEQDDSRMTSSHCYPRGEISHDTRQQIYRQYINSTLICPLLFSSEHALLFASILFIYWFTYLVCRRSQVVILSVCSGSDCTAFILAVHAAVWPWANC